MHQQIPSIDQCGIPSQIPQPIMLCPIQVVYDAQTHTQMVVQHKDDHIQRPQPMLLNVQNTPPWIQNQTQNVIYVQQSPNQMLPYIQPSMIQNPIFQTPYNFPQIMPQESIRPVMQIPTLIQKDMVQNQQLNLNYHGAPTVYENIMQNPIVNINSSGATAKIPFGAQNQENSALKTEMMHLNQFNNMIGNEPMPAQNEVNITANVEVTPFLAQYQKNPKENMPLLINLLTKPPLENENKPTMQNRHVQTDFPIAKARSFNNSVGKQEPQYVAMNNAQQNIEKMNEIPQLNPIDARQYYVRTIRPNITKTPETALHVRSKIHDTINVKAIYRPILPRPVGRPYEFKGPNFVNPNFVTLRAPKPVPSMTLPNCGVMTNYTVVKENVNTPNVNSNNDKATETLNITFMSGGSIVSNNTKEVNTQNVEKVIENPDKVQTAEKNAENKLNVPVIENKIQVSAEKTAENKLNVLRIEEICIEEYEVEAYVKEKEVPIENKVDKVTTSQTDLKPMIQSYIDEIQTRIKGKQEMGREKQEKGKEKQETNKEINSGKQIEITKEIDLDKQVTVVNKKTAEKKIKSGIFILTHVLDGHVIQESNVAFPIQKPTKEKITYEPFVGPDWKNEELSPLKYLHIMNNDNQGGDNAVQEIEEDKDINPFLNLLKTTVEGWNSDQLSSHLTKHNWKETATILKEEEIDGESLFLVTEQQLVYIGVSEKHAKLISEFVQKCTTD